MGILYRAAWPLLRRLDPETAHRFAVKALRLGLVPAAPSADPPSLGLSLWGRDFANPIGLAAGFDKDAEAWRPLLAQGFGFVEVGTVTPAPQPGNPKPRIFRLAADGAVINRLGFNSAGAERVLANLKGERRGPLGVNIGKNKATNDADAAEDYANGARAFAAVADYLVVNVSSPNTPGLRQLQDRGALEGVLEAVLDARAEVAPETPPPILLKVAPDLDDEDKADIAEVAMAMRIDGIVATNTTVARPETLTAPARGETGGLSGRPLFEPSTRVLADFYRLTQGRLALVGVGGIATGADAYAKIRAGASLVQLYTGLVFEGPGLVRRIKRELAALVERDGFANVADAVGADHK